MKEVYKEKRPILKLADLVQAYWCYQNNSDQDIDYTIVSDGCFDLMVYFQVNGDYEVRLTGLWNKAVNVKMSSGVMVFCVRFRPLAAEYLLDICIDDILNSAKTIDNNYLGLDSLLRRDRLIFQDFSDYCDRVFSEIIELKTFDSRKVKLFGIIREFKGDLEISRISDEIGWSSRQMNRYFTKQFGINVKNYCRIIKFKFSVDSLIKGKLFPPTGYHDQSHFIREVKEFADSTPKKMIKKENDRFIQFSEKDDM